MRRRRAEAAAEAERLRAEELEGTRREAYSRGLRDGRAQAALAFRDEALSYQTAVPRHVLIRMAKEWSE